MKFNKLAIAMLVTSSLFVACSDEISETTCDTQYVANTGSIKNAGQAVDLGLPSGTKWANMNVGATSESDNGILFVWGDITGTQVQATTSTSYTDVKSLIPTSDLFETYKGEERVGYLYDTISVYKETYSLSEYSLTKVDSIREAVFDSLKAEYKDKTLDCLINVDDEKYDVIANLIESTEVKYFASKIGDFKPETGASIQGVPVYDIAKDAQHDPATANWGNNWRMPTAEEFQELVDSCKWEFTGAGYKLTSRCNGKSIYLPAAGYRYGNQWYGNGNAGYYATGQILGIYQFPSMEEQYKGSTGSVSSSENMPNMFIYQYGQYNSIGIYNNLSSSFGISVRPVTK